MAELDPSLLIIIIYSVCLLRNREDFIRNEHFHFVTNMITPQHKNICPRNYEINKFGRPDFSYHFKLSLIDGCSGEEKSIYKDMHQFFQNEDPFEGRAMKIMIFVSLYKCYVPKLVKMGTEFLETKILRDDKRCQTITHSIRSTE